VILAGTASWTDPTLLKAGWYPKGVAPDGATPRTRRAKKTNGARVARAEASVRVSTSFS
jgi:hypothetical protein